MRRELQVRFCEGGGVRFRYSTHHHRLLERAIGEGNLLLVEKFLCERRILRPRSIPFHLKLRKLGVELG
jgi:hypothetical protein